MASTTSRLAAVVLAGGALLGSLVVGGTRASSSSASTAASAAFAPDLSGPRYFDAGPVSLPASRIAATSPSWRGGPITTSTGEVVNLLVSDSLPPENTPEHWAEFMTTLVHGPELGLLTVYVATLDEVQSACGDRALGCYTANQMIVPGEVTPDGTTPEEVIRHEYGHHIAFNRVNPPWVAVDWGPKNWASALDVCGKVTRQEAFPGDEGSNYTRNPGEAWAETYRLMTESKVGITTATWPIIAPSFYPSSSALAAAERDVLQPWTSAQTTTYTHVFPRKAKKAWLVPLQTPLDGEFRLSATLPSGMDVAVALTGADKTKVLGRAQWVSQHVKRLTTTICGQRAEYIRVTPSGVGGRVRVSVTEP